MLLLDRQTSATSEPRSGAMSRADASSQAAPIARAQLRLRTSGQVFDLPPGKATIGSSPRCNVRIEQPGVQPLHCLISESADGLRISSWVGDTTLNGKPFEECALAVGDCLSLGRIELEIIDRPAHTIQQPTPKKPPTPGQHSAQSRAGRDRARARRRQLLETLRRERAAQEEVRRQVASLQESHLNTFSEQNELRSKFEESLAELADAREHLSQLQTVEAARRELADRNERLGLEISDLSAQINELRQSESEKAADWQTLKNDYAVLQEQHQQVVDDNGRLRRETDQLANQRSTIDEEYRQLVEEQSQLRGEFDRLVKGNNAVGDNREQLGEMTSRLQNDLSHLANEKAAADDLNRQLVDEKGQLQNEVGRLTNQKHELEVEREGLRRHIDTLVSETRTWAAERGSLADERTKLFHERAELLQQNEALKTRIAQLNEENSAMAVGKLPLVEERDSLNHEIVQLQTRLNALGEENAALVAAKATFAQDQAGLVAERKRLEELERELNAVVAGRDNTSAELYRALLQLSELQQREEQSKAGSGAYEMLSRERDQLHKDTDKLKDEICRLNAERASAEQAWEALSAEATSLGESHERLLAENAQLLANLDEARQKLEDLRQQPTSSSEVTTELDLERARRQQAEAEITAAIAARERRIEEQERRFAEQAQTLAAQSTEFDDRSQRLREQSQQLIETIASLEGQLAEVSEARDALLRAHDESQARLADAELCRIEQSRQIAELESQLAAAHEQAVGLAEKAAKPPATEWEYDERESALHFVKSDAPDESSANGNQPALDVWRNRTDENQPTREPAASSNGSPVTTDADASRFGENDGSIESDVVSESKPSDKPEQASFIERYSHLFAEEDKVEPEKPSCPNDLAIGESREVAARKSFVGESTSGSTDDEESIEQYMAKLLQRVRGETAAATVGVEQASEVPVDGSLVDSSSDAPGPASPLDGSSLDSPATGDENSSNTAPVEPAEPVKRRPAPMPMADLDVLRELANETARRAITWHDLSKLRRKVITKMIVATLAGMTGLWLMLDAPEWRHLEFITACGLFAVAAYWASDTYRTFVNSLKVGSHGRRRGRSHGIETFGEPALPIDVEDGA